MPSNTKTSEVVPATGRTLPTGIGLKESEMALLDELAESCECSRNFLMRWFVRRGLAEHLAGTLPEPPRRLP